MTTVLALLPLLVLLYLAALLLRAGWLLALRPLHPRRILVLALGSASLLTLLGLAQVLPSALWWVTWLVAAGLVATLVVACRRALSPIDPEGLTPRRRRLLAPPSRASVVGDALLLLVLLALAVLAG